MRLALDPLLQNSKVLTDDATAALKDHGSVAQNQLRHRLAEYASGNQVVVTMREQRATELRALGDRPAQTQAGERPDLGHGCGDDGLVVQVDHGLGVLIRLSKQTVDLVAEQPRVVFACDLDNRLERIGVEQGARGVVRVIDADELGIVGHQSIERVDVDVVAVLAIELKDIDLRAAHLGNRVKLLVGGLDGDYVIARFDERGNNQGVGTGRAVRGHNMPGLDRLIETRTPSRKPGCPSMSP